MKRLLTVSVVLVLLLATAVSSVSARRNPIAVPYPRPSSEDHPWGGEQNYFPDSRLSQPGTSSGVAPGIVGIETSLLWRLVMPLWFERLTGHTIVTLPQPSTDGNAIVGENNPGATAPANNGRGN
ncbi:MAG TPA: hypothetical protein PLR32_03500 [candidate division Zixibacteria bacterium]|nr:hypothetical protein [candidate division Zixibacteria bacterium]MDD4917401.1 hypothetical protein [candidate division Zixibacteria bacterium]MDM7972399.1 hypothetical protein [candidate division Zixibacteria bacterium]HOD66203.1 hypothetical protein [candidate division Zixibacteria bacterium]HOZ07304.1 hypothetical protein [candidate division Zixibacteria bacterium]